MSAPLERWEPNRDPIHRIVLQFDVQAVLTACHRWQPVHPIPDDSPAEPRDCPPPPADPAAHPPDILTAELLAAHADRAVALFARYGQPAAAEHVHAAAWLIRTITEAYARQACPCHPCPDCGGRPPPHRAELALCLVYAPTRQALLSHLALAGHAVPLAVRVRGARLAQLLRADALPPDPHQALRNAVGELIAATPPPDGQPAWDREQVREWVDKLAGPPGTAVEPTWQATLTPTAPAGGGRSDAVATVIRPAWRAILTALSTAGGPLPGKKLAARAGYKSGSLRRHTKPMQTAGLIAWTPAGYELMPTE